MKKQITSKTKQKNNNLEILYENHGDHENLRIPYENSENHENPRTVCEKNKKS